MPGYAGLLVWTCYGLVSREEKGKLTCQPKGRFLRLRIARSRASVLQETSVVRSARAFSVFREAMMSRPTIWKRNWKERKKEKYLLVIGQGSTRYGVIMRDRREMRYVTATDAIRTDGANSGC